MQGYAGIEKFIVTSEVDVCVYQFCYILCAIDKIERVM